MREARLAGSAGAAVRFGTSVICRIQRGEWTLLIAQKVEQYDSTFLKLCTIFHTLWKTEKGS